MALVRVQTDVLDIGVELSGPGDGQPLLLLHGWPNAPRAWDRVAAELNARGWRTAAPYCRGSGPTRFLSAATPRVGQGVALAQDAIDLAGRLGWSWFAAGLSPMVALETDD